MNNGYLTAFIEINSNFGIWNWNKSAIISILLPPRLQFTYHTRFSYSLIFEIKIFYFFSRLLTGCDWKQEIENW